MTHFKSSPTYFPMKHIYTKTFKELITIFTDTNNFIYLRKIWSSQNFNQGVLSCPDMIYKKSALYIYCFNTI